MPQHHWTLTDVATRTWLDKFSAVPGHDCQLAGSGNWSIRKETLHGGLSDGVDVVDLDNGRLAVSILPTRGMGLWRGECDGVELGWKSPVQQPVNPAFVNALERGSIGWLAGFNEWLCRCGLDANGPPTGEGGDHTTLHGRIANIPAHRVTVAVDTDGPGTLSVTGVIDETSMFGPCLRLTSTVKTAAGSNRLTIIDEITNLKSSPGDVELLYHINQGAPLLEAGAKLVAPVAEMCPRNARAAEGLDSYDTYLGPTQGFVEQVYFFDLATDAAGQTGILLKNAAGDRGLSLHWNKRQLPYFCQWKNTQATADGYCTGLEPSTNFPNAKGYEREQRRVISLPPGETYRIEFDIAVHCQAAIVAAASNEILSLQKQPATIHRQPLPNWAST